MANKPSYEELEKRVATLEAQEYRLAEVQAELKRNVNFTESLLKSIPTPLFFKDSHGRYLGCNPAFSEITGITTEQIRGKTACDIWPSDHAQIYHQKDLELLENPSQQIYQFEINDRHGRIRKVIYHKNVFRDENGAVAGIVGGFLDITDIRQAQDEIRQRQQFLESVLYHAPDAIVTLDKSQRVIDWNPGAVKMFGYTPEEVIGVQLDDLVARGRHHAEAKNKTALVLSGKRVESSETTRCRKDGTPIRVIVAGSPIMIEEELKGAVAVYTDITGRVKIEEALRTSHHRFLTVLDSIDAMIYVADINTYEILFMNRYMKEIFGGDCTGKTCWKVFRNGTKPCSHCTNEQLVDKNGYPTGVAKWQNRNPISGKWYMNHDRAIEWIDGRIVRLQIAIDITEHKKLEEALFKAQKMEAIGTLASGVAHDFNNLLMGIQGRTSLLSMDLDPAHPYAEHVDAIEEYIGSAVNLTKQLLDFGRGGNYDVKPYDISSLIANSAAMFGRTHKEIKISSKTPPEPMVVKVDKVQFEQVLLNIFVNALQAMPNGGNLYIKTCPVHLNEKICLANQIPPGDYIKISLTDTGIGMTAAIQQKVFDPFFTTKKKDRGTGLGLASAYGIVRNHGGMITVRSKFGHGTTFDIFLPRCQQKATPEAGLKKTMVGGTGTILLVDDEKMILDVGKAMLQRLGYRVITADNGTMAVATVSEMLRDIDLVILDLIMPEIDGKETFNRIRDICPSLPVILASGYSIDGQARQIMDRGCNGFIQKPFSIINLDKRIRKILAKE